jgi:predicted DNA-binding transcriptional regulator AlpA
MAPASAGAPPEPMKTTHKTESPPFVGATWIARKWGVSRATVYRLHDRGALCGAIRIGHQLRWPQASVEAYEREAAAGRRLAR